MLMPGFGRGPRLGDRKMCSLLRRTTDVVVLNGLAADRRWRGREGSMVQDWWAESTDDSEEHTL